MPSKCQTDLIQIRPKMSSLIWVQPVCKGYQQTTKVATSGQKVKYIYYCLIEIIKGLIDKWQFQYLTKLKGPQEGTYLYTTQFHSLR